VLPPGILGAQFLHCIDGIGLTEPDQRLAHEPAPFATAARPTTASLSFTTKKVDDAFSVRVVELVRRAYPEDLDNAFRAHT